MNIIKKRFEEISLEKFYQILRLRSQVFVVEQECPYLDCDNNDQDAYHIYIEENDEIVAYLRVLHRKNQASIGRVVVRKEYRGKGYSRPILNEAIDYITRDTNYNEIKIEAQAGLESFYNSLGFERVSDNYEMEFLPHCDMIRKIKRDK